MNVSNTSNIPPRIMVVDDERDILSIVKRGLESKNRFQVETFIDAESALESLKENSGNYYDLVLTDIRMPKINGFELYKKIRTVDDKVNVCFMTAFEDYRQEFKKSFPMLDEIKCFIRKPNAIEDLVKHVATILG